MHCKFTDIVVGVLRVTVAANETLTVIWPFGISGGSHVITIVDELKGRTWTFFGALSRSGNRVGGRMVNYREQNKVKSVAVALPRERLKPVKGKLTFT